MPKKTDIELSDELIADVGDGPSLNELPSDAELDELFDLGVTVCEECGEPLDEDGECVECWPFESLDASSSDADDDIDYDA